MKQSNNHSISLEITAVLRTSQWQEGQKFKGLSRSMPASTPAFPHFSVAKQMILCYIFSSEISKIVLFFP
jgi:hypothetical protein